MWGSTVPLSTLKCIWNEMFDPFFVAELCVPLIHNYMYVKQAKDQCVLNISKQLWS